MLSFVRRSLWCCRFAAAAAREHNRMQCSPERIPNSAYRTPARPLFLVERMVFRFYYILLQHSLLVWRGGDVGGGASVWMLNDVDAFTDLNLNKARKYSSSVTIGMEWLHENQSSKQNDYYRIRLRASIYSNEEITKTKNHTKKKKQWRGMNIMDSFLLGSMINHFSVAECKKSKMEKKEKI